MLKTNNTCSFASSADSQECSKLYTIMLSTEDFKKIHTK